MADDVATKNDWVGRVLGVRLDGGAKARPEGAAVRLAQGLLVWNSTRSYISQQLKALQQQIIADTEDEADADDIKANVGNIEALLEELDDSLSDKLGELRGTTDLTLKTKLTAEAKAIVARYETYVSTNALMNDIDDNGFMPLDIKPKVSAALKAVMQII